MNQDDKQRIDEWQERVLGQVLKRSDMEDQRRRDKIVQLMADYQQVFLSTDAGQRVLLDLLTVLGEFEVVNDYNAKAYAFLGKRQVSQYIKALIGETDKDLTSLYNMASLLKNNLPQIRER